jgi:hypothetical protein
MARVLGDAPKEDFVVPERVVLLPVDEDASNECVKPVLMAFVRGLEPAVNCGPRKPAAPLPTAFDPAAPGSPVTPAAGAPAAPVTPAIAPPVPRDVTPRGSSPFLGTQPARVEGP